MVSIHHSLSSSRSMQVGTTGSSSFLSCILSYTLTHTQTNKHILSHSLTLSFFLFLPSQSSLPLSFASRGSGPRTCLGMNMAYVEAKVLAACLLQRFKITRAQGNIVVVVWRNGKNVVNNITENSKAFDQQYPVCRQRGCVILLMSFSFR